MILRLALLLFCLGAIPAQASCRLALLLALDVSSSVDEREYLLQRDGLAAALRDPQVQAAVFALGAPPIALAIYEWSGRRQSAVLLDWTLLDTPQVLEQALDKVMAMPRSHTRFPTAMGYALGFGATLMRQAPACERQVIDISGDGITNDGFRPQLAYKHYPFDDIVVNGLAVLGADPKVEGYYRDEVRHGPGAFVETAEGYEGYRNAMTRKLLREIADMVVGESVWPGQPRPRSAVSGYIRQ